MRKPTSLLLVVAAAILAGCSKKPESAPSEGDAAAPVAIAPQGKVLEAAENEDPDAGGTARKAASGAKAKERVEIPAGSFVAGSTPGDKGRDPVLEPALLEVELGGFSIDKLPYPNDPAAPPMTGVSRSRATELCQQAGGRLCTELEWERACKGAEGQAYAGGAAWDPACAKEPSSCASGFGVLAMGAAEREWTASEVLPVEDVQTKAAAVRGAKGSASAVDHRCARRMAVEPTTSAEDLGFRCCYGAPNAATIPAPQHKETFRKAEISPAQLAEMFASAPQLKSLGREITYFKDPDDAKLVLARGDAGTVPNTSFTTQPMLWNPVPGEEVLVVTGRADKDSFIVAFYRLPGDRYRIAGSLILKNEKGPVAIAYNSYIRRRMGWATCWDCPAEAGNITYRDDNRVVITQK